MQQQERLVTVLEQITKRYYSIFFSKLVLMQEQDQTQEHYIRHYDIQCQAVQSMADTLNTKIKTLQFRSFHLIKNYRKSDMFRRKTKTQNPNQSHVINSANLSFNEKRYTQNNNRYRRDAPGTRTNAYFNTVRSPNSNNSELLNEMDYSMSALMSKMKYLNSKFVRANGQDLDPQEQDKSQKFLKRKLIINKLNQLQNGLSQLITQQESNINTRYVTSSNVTNRHHLLINGNNKNSKTTRNINKTFF